MPESNPLSSWLLSGVAICYRYQLSVTEISLLPVSFTRRSQYLRIMIKDCTGIGGSTVRTNMRLCGVRKDETIDFRFREFSRTDFFVSSFFVLSGSLTGKYFEWLSISLHHCRTILCTSMIGKCLSKSHVEWGSGVCAVFRQNLPPPRLVRQGLTPISQSNDALN